MNNINWQSIYQKKSQMGAIHYHKIVLQETPIGLGIRRISQHDRTTLHIKFSCVYYLLKQEGPFTDYPKLLKLRLKNNGSAIGLSYQTERAAAQFTEIKADVHYEGLSDNIHKAHYYSILNDGSSDTTVSEKELVYALYLEDGKPKIGFVGIENVNNVNAEGILECIKESFNKLGITNFLKSL